VLSYSAWIGLVRFCNPDAVVGELEVCAGQFGFGHVAGGAIVFRDAAGFGFCFSARMTGLALRVVVGWLRTDFFMRIVTGYAADARVVGVVAKAAPEAIRLKADVGEVVVAAIDDIGPGVMTAAAEVPCLLCGEVVQAGQCFGNNGFPASLDQGCEMLIDGLMTMAALNAGSHLVQGELLV